MQEKILPKKKNKQFYGVDLHVHTPASQCYKGEKSDKEYIEILRRYSLKNINVIAVTDHNTINGYKNFIKIKESLLNKMNVLKEFIEKHDELKSEYENLKSDIDLFNSMLILPGIEFECTPGIHMLLIFRPESNLDNIEKFLYDSGYLEEIQGKEEPDTLSNIDVLGILDKSASLDAIVIAAHADSNKGIYKKLEGTYRASVFRSSQLSAICYNSPVTCQKMKSMLQNREYNREKPLAFLQASDYHGGEDEAGSCITYFQLDSLTYDSIYLALSKPDECISSTPNPQTIHIIENIVKDFKTRTFENLETEEQKDLIRKSACAFLNDGYGTLVFGVSTNYGINMIGIKKSEDECYDLLKECFEPLNNRYSMVRFEISLQQFSNSRYVIIVRLSSNKKTLYSINNEVYIFKENRIVIATPHDIEQIVESNLLSRMEEYNRLNQLKFDKAIDEINFLKEDPKKFLILNSIEKNSFYLPDITDVFFVNRYSGEFPVDIGNGESEGNVYYAERVEPRLPKAYLRCTCPRTRIYDAKNLNVEKMTGDALVITTGGGCYYIKDENEWTLASLDKTEPTLIALIDHSFKSSISIVSLVGWLKSSLLIWYTYTALSEVNIYKPNIFKNIPIPLLDIMKPGNEVESTVLEISKKEYELLEHINSNMFSDTDEANKYIDTHNSEITKLAQQIDKLFFEAFNISSNEEEIIKRLFQSKQIFNVL